MPKHKNVIQNVVNIELFYDCDVNQNDCVGWVTIMEKADIDLRTILKKELISLDERKKIAGELIDGFSYLEKIGIEHRDRKLENVLLQNGTAKIIDYGLVLLTAEQKGFYEMGYARYGSKYKSRNALRKLNKNDMKLTLILSCRNAWIF